ncbi:enolase C-terminal domain-like protein [Variovorax atrisoli]|uniref:enolase C-terminal domain-like protein n=1 Tax=Variovorax TaxID=34072 RepID=UPI000369BEC3|nr:enolase C-terminal domain-like protein [Variovorax paradoxus]
MRIIDLQEAAFPVQSTMRNAVFSFAEMTTSIVAVRLDSGAGSTPVTGYAFNSTGRYACGQPMRERFFPRLLRAQPESLLDAAGVLDPAMAVAAMLVGEKPGGHAERSIAIGTIETALWDAIGKAQELPTAEVLARRYRGGTMQRKVSVYVGGGWYRPGGVAKDVADEIRSHQAGGYTHVKIKVGGASLDEDLRRIDCALSVLPDSGHLAVDANCKFQREEALRYAEALAPYGLRWFEEPCDPNDYSLMAELASVYAPPLSAGENLYGMQDVTNLVRLGGWRSEKDLIQVDPPQSYGLHAFASMVRALEAQGWPAGSHFPHGGNQMSLALVAGLGLGGCEAYPGVFGSFGGFADDTHVEGGFVHPPQRPGIGFEGHSALHALMSSVGAGLKAH